jgi:osmoprotectant transport system permease protein
MTIGPIDLDWIADNLDLIGGLLLEHLYLTLLAVVIGLLVSILLALASRRWRWMYAPILGATGALYAIPSLAMFALLVPITGLTNIVTPLTALVAYTLLIVTRNVVEGLDGVPAETVEAATGLGYRPAQRMWRVELPLALPVIVAGLRIATVTTIGLVTVTALIGFGGLGYLIVTIGINRGSFGLTAAFTGIVLVVVLAAIADVGLLALQRALTPWARRRAA